MNLRKFVFLAFFLPIAAFADEGIPEYQNWSCSRETTVIWCSDDNPLLANNVITEFRDNFIGTPKLIIWQTFERSKDVFRWHGTVKSYQIERIDYRFYRHEGDKWILLERRERIRALSPKNTVLPLFEKESVDSVSTITL